MDRLADASNIRVRTTFEAGSARSDLDVDYLATAVHTIGWIYPVGHESTAIGRILGEDRRLEAIGSTTFAASLLRLFAFRLSHGRSVIKEFVSRKAVE
mgnify:CR=1 FL=1